MLKYIKFLFVFLLFLTPLPQHWFGASSFLTGTLFFFAFFIFSNGVYQNYNLDKTNYKIIVTIPLLLLFHFYLTQVFFREGDFVRGFSSILVLIIMLFLSFLFSKYLLVLNQKQFISLMNFIFNCFILVFIGQYFKQIQNLGDHAKPIMPFNEPSHYALFFLPFYFFRLYITKNKIQKYLFFFGGLLIGILLSNLTMIIGVFLSAVIVYRSKVILTLLILTFLFPLYSAYINLEYFTSRIFFLEDNNNLSKLVLFQGWQLAYEGFVKSLGFGIGFQQLGFVELNTEAGYIIEKVLEIEGGVNKSDAGLTAPKVISELGLIGVILIIYYIFYCIKFSLKISKVKDVKLIFAFIVFISFSVDLFVRGIGYFNAPFFLFLTSIFLITKIPSKQ